MRYATVVHSECCIVKSTLQLLSPTVCKGSPFYQYVLTFKQTHNSHLSHRYHFFDTRKLAPLTDDFQFVYHFKQKKNVLNKKNLKIFFIINKSMYNLGSLVRGWLRMCTRIIYNILFRLHSVEEKNNECCASSIYIAVSKGARAAKCFRVGVYI